MSKLIVCNMKMNQTKDEVINYINELNGNDIVTIPSSIYIPYYLGNFKVGIQNVYECDMGAYTGEVSSYQANSLGVEYALIGHSERRKYFNETNELINKKVINSINHLKVILCIGESLTDYNNNQTKEVLKHEINTCLKDVNKEVIIAYEPLWAIGTGLTPSIEEIDNISNFIKDEVNNNYGYIPTILYGGSVNEKNISAINNIKNIDGFLIGGASLNIDSMKQIIKIVNN